MASGMMEFLPLWFSPSALRAYLAEFISTFLFMFATAGSAVSARMVTPDATSDASSLVATAVAQAFALFVAVFIAADASGGHANPAVTFAFAIGGHIAVPTAVLCWVAQLLGATLACLVVHTLSAGQAVPTTRIAADMTGFGASVLEAMTTFMVVYTVHAACDPRVLRAGGRRGATETATGSLAVGLVTGACALATASLTGASMNPARSFGPAVVGEDFTNQAVYWAGPMAGAALAVLVHQHVVYPASSLADPEARRGSVETVVANRKGPVALDLLVGGVQGPSFNV